MTTTATTIRAPKPADLEDIKRIAVAAKMFSEQDVGFFDEVFAGFFDGTLEENHWLVSAGRDDEVLGATYYAPEPFADRMWNLYFIAVDPAHQGQGIGRALMAQVEETLVARGEDVARVIVVETSSTEQYARTRSFYKDIGYDEEARIRQFYGPSDDKVVFWKSLC